MKEEKKNNLGIILIVALVVIIAVVVAILLLSGKKYTISFSNVTGYNSVEVKKGDTLTKPADPTKEGYRFVGWYYNNELFDFSKEVTGDMTLEARFEAVEGNNDEDKVVVSFDTDGGNSIKSQTIEKNSKASKPSDPVKEGYTFVEWQLNGEAYNFSKTVTKDITLKAEWKKDSSSSGDSDKYTVTFNSNGGSSVSKQTVEKDGTASKPEDPTRSGYTFVGWTLNGKTYNFSSKVTKNITLTAKWKANGGTTTNPTTKFTVTFNSNGGSAVAKQTVNSGSKATQPKAPTRPGYTFTGWTLNGKAYNFGTAVTKNITLVAGWKANSTTPVKNYTVVFKTDGGSSVATQVIPSGGKAVKPANPTKEGYVFAGWTLSGKAYDFNATITGSLTLVAKWNAKTFTYTVTEVTDPMGPTLQSIIKVFDGNTDITSKVTFIANANGANLGMSRYQGGLLVKKTDVSKIAKVYYVDGLRAVTKR